MMFFYYLGDDSGTACSGVMAGRREWSFDSSTAVGRGRAGHGTASGLTMLAKTSFNEINTVFAYTMAKVSKVSQNRNTVKYIYE